MVGQPLRVSAKVGSTTYEWLRPSIRAATGPNLSVVDDSRRLGFGGAARGSELGEVAQILLELGGMTPIGVRRGISS